MVATSKNREKVRAAAIALKDRYDRDRRLEKLVPCRPLEVRYAHLLKPAFWSRRPGKNAATRYVADKCLMLQSFVLFARPRMRLVASFVTVRLAGCRRQSRTCEAGWIVTRMAAAWLLTKLISSGMQINQASQSANQGPAAESGAVRCAADRGPSKGCGGFDARALATFVPRLRPEQRDSARP